MRLPWPLLNTMLDMAEGMEAAKRTQAFEASILPHMKAGKQREKFAKLRRKYESVAPVRETTLEEMDQFAKGVFGRK